MPKLEKMQEVLVVIIFIAFFIMIEWFGREKQYAIAEFGLRWNRFVRYGVYYVIIMAIIWFWGKEQEFIYFQF